MTVAIGVHLGQRHSPTAICAVEAEWRRAPENRSSRSHFVVRFVERLPAGSTFPECGMALRRVERGVRRRIGYSPSIFVDATGLGSPVVALLEAEVGRLTSVYFNHGDRRLSASYYETRLGKAWLTARLQTLLQSQRLHLPEGPGFRSLAQELLDFQLTVTPDANERYGAFPVGTQDELVTALGLAVQTDPSSGMRLVRYACC